MLFMHDATCMQKANPATVSVVAAMLSKLEGSPDFEEATETAKDVAGIGFVGTTNSLHIMATGITYSTLVSWFRYGQSPTLLPTDSLRAHQGAN